MFCFKHTNTGFAECHPYNLASFLSILRTSRTVYEYLQGFTDLCYLTRILSLLLCAICLFRYTAVDAFNFLYRSIYMYLFPGCIANFAHLLIPSIGNPFSSPAFSSISFPLTHVVNLSHYSRYHHE